MPQGQNVAGAERNAHHAVAGEAFFPPGGQRGVAFRGLDQAAGTLHGNGLRFCYMWTCRRRAASEMEPLSEG